MNAWAQLATALTVTFLIELGGANDAGAQDPRAFIQETADQAVVILQLTGASSAQKIRQLEDIAHSRFDFETMARLVLARNWSTLTSEQQREFVQEFRRHLCVTYGKNIESYRDATIGITGDREEARGDWTVTTLIRRSGNDALVEYRLRKIDGPWKIIDVAIERVSLVANFRSQLQDVVANNGADEMLRMLREKNATGQSILPNDGKLSPGDATVK